MTARGVLKKKHTLATIGVGGQGAFKKNATLPPTVLAAGC
jgi:hypothetical protein